MEQKKEQKPAEQAPFEPQNVNPNSPKNRLLRLVVGMGIVIMGVVIFNISSKWYAEAEAKDAKEKAEREEKIRELVEPDDSIGYYEDMKR